jgi:WASH complex subunit strumpellin
MGILKRFFDLFESMLRYNKDLQRYITELEDGVFIQLNLETVLDNEDGKQLMSEAVYMWCVMLVLLDVLVEGTVRERLVMSYLRYKGHNELPLIDDVCTLCRATGFVPPTSSSS